MARAVVWSSEARADLRQIEAYIAVSSPLSAQHVIERIRETAAKLADSPMPPAWFLNCRTQTGAKSSFTSTA